MPSLLRSTSTWLTVAAVVVAITGTAAVTTTITGKQVKNGSLTGADVKNSSLTGADIKNGSISAEDLAAGTAVAGPAGATGATGAAGTTGGTGLAGTPGAAGSAKAWGIIDTDPVTPTLVNSSTPGATVTRNGAGTYCLTIPGVSLVTNTIITTVDFQTTTTAPELGVIVARSQLNSFCGPTAFEIFVKRYGTATVNGTPNVLIAPTPSDTVGVNYAIY